MPPPPAAPAPEPPAYESVPAVAPEPDPPAAGEDTNEIEPLPPVSAWEPPPAHVPPADAPLPPPTELHPATPPPSPPPPAPRPFSTEGASFRSAIDAARERVHGAAREATSDDGEDTEPADERP
jgi:hypothetical protein